MPDTFAALYSPETGFSRSAIMTRAVDAARELRAWQTRFAASPKGLKEGFKPQSWASLMSHALRNAWKGAKAERAQHCYRQMPATSRLELASLSTDGRMAA
jgi:hypothetical protein